MSIDTRTEVMRGIQGHYGDDWKGLDPTKPTPNNYTEFTTSVLPEFLVASEQQLEDGIVAFDQAITDRETLQTTEETQILLDMGLSRAQLKMLNRVLKNLDQIE